MRILSGQKNKILTRLDLIRVLIQILLHASIASCFAVVTTLVGKCQVRFYHQLCSVMLQVLVIFLKKIDVFVSFLDQPWRLKMVLIASRSVIIEITDESIVLSLYTVFGLLLKLEYTCIIERLHMIFTFWYEISIMLVLFYMRFLGSTQMLFDGCPSILETFFNDMVLVNGTFFYIYPRHISNSEADGPGHVLISKCHSHD